MNGYFESKIFNVRMSCAAYGCSVDFYTRVGYYSCFIFRYLCYNHMIISRFYSFVIIVFDSILFDVYRICLCLSNLRQTFFLSFEIFYHILYHIILLHPVMKLFKVKLKSVDEFSENV